MVSRVCKGADSRGCPAASIAASGSLCPSCAQAREVARGSSSARGYGYKHKARSVRERSLAVGKVCHFCKQPILAGQPLALDHTEDRSAYRGVAHFSCNASDGARRRNNNGA